MRIILKINTLVLAIFLLGCQTKEETKNVLTDVAAFNGLVTVDIQPRTVSWEVFGTPEYTGGVPGPTDHVTLIAQTEASNDEKFDQRPTTGTVWIAPESSRPWLDEA